MTSGRNFIEPLPDYAARRARVEAGETLAIAVMVGRVREGFYPAIDEEWFPSDLIALLGLASGRGVGVPFVELRGPAGELVAQLHIQVDASPGERGRGLIEEVVDRSTGALLSAFLSSEHCRQPWLRVALRHLLRAFTGSITVEDRLSHLFRTIEGLCAGLDLNSSRPLEVTHETREQVLLELTNCTTALDLIAAQAGTPDRERIWGLKSRLKEIEANRPSFPTQLEALIDRANLPDASWLRDFRFRTRIDKAPTRWTSAAGAYRNRIFHAGFIDFEKYDIDNAISFISHLSDVLIRVVFGLIGFDGQYKPPCGTHGMTIHNNRYWPTSVELSAPLLRYVD